MKALKLLLVLAVVLPMTAMGQKIQLLEPSDNPSEQMKTFAETEGDFNGDGVINGKDYAYIMKNYTNEVKAAENAKFREQVGFKKSSYPGLVIQT